jgi:hypothetical protein
MGNVKAHPICRIHERRLVLQNKSINIFAPGKHLSVIFLCKRSRERFLDGHAQVNVHISFSLQEGGFEEPLANRLYS